MSLLGNIIWLIFGGLIVVPILFAVARLLGVYAIVAYQRDPFAGLASRWSGGPGLAAGLVVSRIEPRSSVLAGLIAVALGSWSTRPGVIASTMMPEPQRPSIPCLPLIRTTTSRASSGPNHASCTMHSYQIAFERTQVLAPRVGREPGEDGKLAEFAPGERAPRPLDGL